MFGHRTGSARSDACVADRIRARWKSSPRIGGIAGTSGALRPGAPGPRGFDGGAETVPTVLHPRDGRGRGGVVVGDDSHTSASRHANVTRGAPHPIPLLSAEPHGDRLSALFPVAWSRLRPQHRACGRCAGAQSDTGGSMKEPAWDPPAGNTRLDGAIVAEGEGGQVGIDLRPSARMYAAFSRSIHDPMDAVGRRNMAPAGADRRSAPWIEINSTKPERRRNAPPDSVRSLAVLPRSPANV
ncbi:hypothetical protein HNQ52_001916 [Chiayiivirga flava]|uniref:Uncharacterized protein n=1 Tax=Chiayiivirga flava TaxID=659595 RepID=A0A7W8G0J0_9GAMM|nr:hypothetical protein [Chiayiivirga flava]